MNETPSHHQEELYEQTTLGRTLYRLRAYAPVILISIVAIVLGYALVAIALYLSSPSQKIVSQTFRLDFEGATSGRYPNGLKFSPAEIVATPILLTVYRNNGLSRFVSFGRFSEMVFVLESNRAYDRLIAEYGTKLADPRLSPLDRDRIAEEFRTKRESLAKNDYSINLLSNAGQGEIPVSVAKKVLSNTLAWWARYAAVEQKVLQYRISILSPDVVSVDAIEQLDPVISIQLLRSKLRRVLDNIDSLAMLPGAEMARGHSGQSLEEVRIRLEEILRFRLEPLAQSARASTAPTAIRFLETQLAYDERQLEARQQEANAIRGALLAYTSTNESGRPPAAQPDDASSKASDRVVPQLSESFLDRLVRMASNAADLSYRQQLVNELRTASLRVIPAQAAVAYDRGLLQQLRGSPRGEGLEPAVVVERLLGIQTDGRTLVQQINEIYSIVSKNLHPSTHLYSMTGIPAVTIERSASPRRLALYGVLLTLLLLPIIITAAIVHDRYRQEEELESGASEQLAHFTAKTQ